MAAELEAKLEALPSGGVERAAADAAEGAAGAVGKGAEVAEAAVAAEEARSPNGHIGTFPNTRYL